jgi:hypothetical protein
MLRGGRTRASSRSAAIQQRLRKKERLIGYAGEMRIAQRACCSLTFFIQDRIKCRENPLLIRIATAGSRFVVPADEILTAFLELEVCVEENSSVRRHKKKK